MSHLRPSRYRNTWLLGSVTDALHNLPKFIKNEIISKVSHFRIFWVLWTFKLVEVAFSFPSVLLLCLFFDSGLLTVVHTTI